MHVLGKGQKREKENELISQEIKFHGETGKQAFKTSLCKSIVYLHLVLF